MDISPQKTEGSSNVEKVTKMSNAVGDIQERLPALERSHKELQQSMEHIACEQEKLTKMFNAVGDIEERFERSHREVQQSMEHIAKLLQELSDKTSGKTTT